MKFPATFSKDDSGGYVVTLRDIPEAITQGDTLEEARKAAIDALITAMDFYIEDNRQVPVSSKADANEEYVELPASVSAKIMLLNEMVKKRIRPSDLAKEMKIKPQEVTRIMDLNHATKIDTLASAFMAVGQRLEFQLSDIT
jgi:antitoxin HicB